MGAGLVVGKEPQPVGGAARHRAGMLVPQTTANALAFTVPGSMSYFKPGIRSEMPGLPRRHGSPSLHPPQSFATAYQASTSW